MIRYLAFPRSRAWRTPYPLQLAAQDIVHFGSLCIVIVDALLPLFQIVLVISPVCIDCPVVEFHHSIAHIVQEIPVVRHHQQGAARMPEIILEELDGVDVQMVGRLVHYEEVRLGRQHHCQRHSLHLPAREILHQTVRTESEIGDELFDSQLVSEQGIIVQPLCELPARL